MQGLKPVTMSDLIQKAHEASNENLLIVWAALARQDLNEPYSLTNPDITMLDWAQLVKSELDQRGLWD